MSVSAVNEAVAPSIVKAALCIPTNDLFTNILAQPLGLVTGGLGGLLDWLVVLVVVILAVFAIVRIVRAKRAHEDIGAIVWVMIVPLAAVLAIAIYRGAMATVGNMC
jgi:hypothetical protein